MTKNKLLERLVSQLKKKGHSKESAFRIAVSGLQKSKNMKNGKLTGRGKKRAKMGAAKRAISRDAGGRKGFHYNQLTNHAKKNKTKSKK